MTSLQNTLHVWPNKFAETLHPVEKSVPIPIIILIGSFERGLRICRPGTLREAVDETMAKVVWPYFDSSSMMATSFGIYVASPNSTLDGSSSQQRLINLIERIARSDQNALAEFYDSTSPAVLGFVKKMLNNPFQSEDTTLEVYLKVWRNAGRYDPIRGAPWTWLLMLARSSAIDCLRACKKELSEQPLGCLTSIADDSPNAEEALAGNGTQADIRSALESLSQIEREAIELSFYSGLSHAEIAARLGQPLGTVKSHIRIGMLRLRDRLESQ